MKTHSRIQMTDGSFITRAHECAKWKALPAPGKFLTNSMAAKAAKAQNKTVADWMAKSVAERQERKKRYIRGEK